MRLIWRLPLKMQQPSYKNQRFLTFKISFGVLFFILLTFLFYRQTYQTSDFKEKERKQGQRRITMPGPRGNIFDRNGNLLIGNQAHYSAKLHLGSVNEKIREKKKVLRQVSREIESEIIKNKILSLEKAIGYGYDNTTVSDRFVRLSGKVNIINDQAQRVIIHFQGERIPVTQNKTNTWYAQLPKIKYNRKISVDFEGISKELEVNLANLLSIKFSVDQNGKVLPANPSSDSSNKSFLNSILSAKPSWDKIIWTEGSSLVWEARRSVVQDYTNVVNKLTGREKIINLKPLIRHWREKLLLPFEIADNLSASEYAVLIEGIDASSPIEVKAEAVRHYPNKSLASHVLGYVGSGYEANTEELSGNDLTTFEIKGRKGKAGLEKVFDEKLKGTDGTEIWRVNPDGTRYEQIEKKVSQKGKNLQISIDSDLQRIAEDSILRMVKSVSNHRILPDENWRKTILRRTNQALKDSSEKRVTAQLLLSSFIDAPYPLSGEQASTVAGFEGTSEDATKLLNQLFAKGVLAKPNPEKDLFELSPPPLPPGAAVLIDLKSGEILTLASKPNYDLSNLTPYISQDVYDRIQRREAWLPRAWHPGYAPASPFKIVTAVAGYRAGLLDANISKTCDGIYRGMECHVFPGIHGEIKLKDAISQSCNVYFYRLAEKIGFQDLIDTAKLMGLDDSPNIELPSLRDKPIVPDPDWKSKRIGVRWTLEDTFNIAIGQGGLRQSPLQMACMVARIATNRKDFQPTLIHSKNSSLPPSSSLGVEKKLLDEIIMGMQQATEKGTARRCQIKGISIAGKTGTGQWRNHNMNLNLAWFVGFAPVNEPEVAVAILVEGVIPQDQVQGGLTATPVAKDLLQAYFDKKNANLVIGKN